MKALILNGAHANDSTAESVSAALCGQLQSRGWEIEQIVLREQKIGVCAGDFFCWLRSPGMCNTNDDNRLIAAKMIQSDLLIWLTPITFGGYSSALKRAVDHLIQNILPFFTRIDGEVHHQPRYKRYPNLLVIGWMDGPDAASEAVFRHLAQRNSLNMYSPASVCGVVTCSPSTAELSAQIDAWLAEIAAGARMPVPALPTPANPAPAPNPLQQAVLLVGSPRTNKSSSGSLGGYLLDQLAARGVATQTIQIYTTLNSPVRLQAMLETLERADLIVLAFPLYVDSLPAPVMVALEQIAAHRAGRRSGQRFVAITNCGFPEAHHCDNALAVCARFADQAGLIWAGGMALGAGEGMVHGTPLAEIGGMGRNLRRALDMAAQALAGGSPIPHAAMTLLAKPVIPPWLYLLVGGLSWGQQAKRYGNQRQLRQAPYQQPG
ncbi:MAG: NAD(P)H dehydrogenase [Oscillochloris sp.]|nr:NAD(P)H dehydrogenase [Oscillochloris sp.]